MSEVPARYAPAALAPIPPDGACAGCGTTERLVRDHCHRHNWIRDIVCRGCNMRLGYIDQGIVPPGSGELLAALIAVRNRCPDCEPITVASLARTWAEACGLTIK